MEEYYGKETGEIDETGKRLSCKTGEEMEKKEQDQTRGG